MPGTILPGRDQPPPPPPLQTPDFELTIESLRRAAMPDTADAIRFRLNGITIRGVTAFPANHFAPLTAPLIGKDVKLADIAAVAEAVESAYRKSGYLLSRAYVPPQRVHDGVLEIVVVEGYVAHASAASAPGAPPLDPRLDHLVSGYFRPVLREKPLSTPAIERALLLADDLPGRTASGLLRPSPDQPGASDLVVTVTREPFSPSFSIDNRVSPYAGPVMLHAGAAFSPGLAAGDWLAGSAGATPDLSERIEGSLSYALPVGGNGLIASIDASGSHGKPGEQLRAIALVTSSYAFSPQLRYPLIRSRRQSLYVSGGGSLRSADVMALGNPFSRDDWRTGNVTISYVESGWLNGASAVAVTLTQGLHVFGAARNGAASLSRPGARTDFTKLSFYGQRIQRIAGPLNLSLKMVGQYAFASLVAGEQVSFGGDGIGRGYDPSAILGDHGIGAGAELRYDKPVEGELVKSMQPYVFLDTAWVWNRLHNNGGNDGLTSIGAGLRMTFAHRLTAGLELAQELRSVPDNDGGRRSTRVLFDIGLRL